MEQDAASDLSRFYGVTSDFIRTDDAPRDVDVDVARTLDKSVIKESDATSTALLNDTRSSDDELKSRDAEISASSGLIFGDGTDVNLQSWTERPRGQDFVSSQRSSSPRTKHDQLMKSTSAVRPVDCDETTYVRSDGPAYDDERGHSLPLRPVVRRSVLPNLPLRPIPVYLCSAFPQFSHFAKRTNCWITLGNGSHDPMTGSSMPRHDQSRGHRLIRSLSSDDQSGVLSSGLSSHHIRSHDLLEGSVSPLS